MRSVVCGLALLVAASTLNGQSQSASTPAAIPVGATGLQGSPTVQVETTVDEAKRRILTTKEANEHALSISVNGGRYFWTSRQNEELTLRTSGEFTYLTTENPGRYVRLRQIKGRLMYAEHVDMDSRSVTYYGELRILLGK